MNNTKFAIAMIFLCVSFSSANSQTVEIGFELKEGQATSDPLVLPNQDLEIMVTPELEIATGQFNATFTSDIDRAIVDGAMTVDDLVASGSLNLVFASQIEIFGNAIPASATLSGPLLVTQVTDSNGTLGEQTVYIETQPGTYDVSFGPFECSDSAFGLFCLVLENGLQLNLPEEPLQAEGLPLPFLGGVYSDLQSDGESSVGSRFDLAFPVGDEESFGFELTLDWQESSRITNTPEPCVSLAVCCGLFYSLGHTRRRRIYSVYA